jgi:SAM-dependent methyltransferase
MSTGLNSEYYDLLYQNKDYRDEAQYYSGIIQKNRPLAKTMVDFGCGTGKHDVYFAEKGFEVSGVDLSQGMIDKAVAGKSGITFQQGDIRSIQLDQKFDVAVALFGVMTYITDNDDLIKNFTNVIKHLHPKGLFVFDFWYGAGVLSDKPKVAIKREKNQKYSIVRMVEPTLISNDNRVEIRSTFHVFDKEKRLIDIVYDVYSARYFFIPEIKMLAKQTGFNILSFQESLSDKPMNSQNWYGLCVLENS